VNRMFRLGPVLRARKAQEDSARNAVIQSRAEIRDAQALAKRRALDLAGAEAPAEGTARAMVASMVARQSLAATLSGAHRLVADAEDQNTEKIAELADAAKRRRAVERMAERHAETVRVTDLAVDQANIDELAVTQKARNAARGLDGQTEERANTLRTGSGTAAGREAVGRDAALAVHATRTAGSELVPAALALAARRGDLVAATRIVDKAQQAAPDADLQGKNDTEQNRSRA
jgi:flagellar protein FliJ